MAKSMARAMILQGFLKFYIIKLRVSLLFCNFARCIANN